MSSLPPLPEWSLRDDLGGLVPSEIRTALRAYGEACAAAEIDCRVCANYTTQTGGCISVVQCVDGDCFKPTTPRQYWAIRARGETK